MATEPTPAPGINAKLQELLEAISDLKDTVILKFDEFSDTLEAANTDVKTELLKIANYQKTILEPNQQVIYAALGEILKILQAATATEEKPQ